jgi:hypothetical protein
MADTPKSILAYWVLLKEKKVVIPLDVWAVWKQKFFPVLNDIEGTVTRYSDFEIPVEEGKEVRTKINSLGIFLKELRPSDEKCFCEDGRIYLEKTVKALVAHYVGNDLHAMLLRVLEYIDDFDLKPIEKSALEKILNRIKTIKEFLVKLEAETRAA